jgi:hypothetical protein
MSPSEIQKETDQLIHEMDALASNGPSAEVRTLARASAFKLRRGAEHHEKLDLIQDQLEALPKKTCELMFSTYCKHCSSLHLDTLAGDLPRKAYRVLVKHAPLVLALLGLLLACVSRGRPPTREELLNVLNPAHAAQVSLSDTNREGGTP